MTLSEYREQLAAHVTLRNGGAPPTVVQSGLISRAAALTAHLQRLDRDILASGGRVPASYVSLQNSLTRVLVALDAGGTSEPAERVSLADILGAATEAQPVV